MKTIEPDTLQQEAGLKAYSEHLLEMNDMGLAANQFWEWYAHRCHEEGFYNDRASYQYDEDES